MRIRRMRERDTAAAAALMSRCGFAVDAQTLAQRLKIFQYQRSHIVAVAEHRGRLLALMHLGAEPSLTCGRCVRVYTLFVDAEAQPGAPPESLRAYMMDWARRHGSDVLIEASEMKTTGKKAI
jgi:hypothetical protein